MLRPALTVELCEPIAKKGAFLRTAIRELGLGERVRLDPRRGEAIADAEPGRFDVALSRATFAPEVWLALGRRLVRPGGRVFVAGGRPMPRPATSYLGRRRAYFGGRRALVELDVPRGTFPGATHGRRPRDLSDRRRRLFHVEHPGCGPPGV